MTWPFVDHGEVYNANMADQILYRKLLGEIIKLKSISTDSVYVGDIEKTAKWLEKLFGENGFRTQIVSGYDNPIVIAEYVVSVKAPTCLVYGHYDVQPAEINDGWMKEPFELSEMDGRLYGRGVVDNKGQFLVHVATVISLIKEKKLGCNVKFMIEGNEETGSPAIEEFVKKNKDLLKADFTLISDGEMNLKQPNIEAGFRGGFNSTLTITSGKTDLHSGIYGGAVPSSVLEMVKLINPKLLIDELSGLVLENNLVESKSEFRRLLDQGGIYINETRVEKNTTELSLNQGENVVRLGKRKYLKLVV